MKRVCPICHTTKFKSSSDSGLVCKYGHKLLGIQKEQQEDDTIMGGLGRRRKKIKTEVQESRVSPAKQASDFMRIIQFGLQVMSRSMVQDLGFPAELEAVVQIVEAYLFEANIKEKKDGESTIKQDTMKLELEELEALAAKSGSSDDDHDDDDDDSPAQGSSRLKWPPLDFSHTLVFLYLGCIYLNLSVLPYDFIRWAKEGQIPYLKMQERIPSQTMASLSLFLSNSMTMVPGLATLVRRSYEFTRCFLFNCNQSFPPLNVPLYIDRFCHQFFLPVEGFYCAQFIFEQYRHRYVTDLHLVNRYYKKPQVTTVLMACVLATVKLMHGIGTHGQDTNLHQDIKANLIRWRKVQEDQEDLDNIVQYLRDTSVASKIAAHSADRNNIILNLFHQGPVRMVHRKQRPSDLFLDASHLVQDQVPLFDKDVFYYYARKSGFGPLDYVDLIELATCITGEKINASIESTLKIIDRLLVQTSHAKTLLTSEYKARFP
ncbi:uncharacterized protein B0P05DRAFT_527120 [Gilbertella persicaria]|uniref:uncharacterized protein n=1 Tax=Gilbertella persicaria TaxID=101096 RepID=UPI00221EFC7B|nr:uncharacterized protein B0P05DRAFT_527120 [Gilbertella persicaria]KAI8091357.1 hypothetical protein B0P05DRAFT_527120 [Gilbertella persicaria]